MHRRWISWTNQADRVANIVPRGAFVHHAGRDSVQVAVTELRQYIQRGNNRHNLQRAVFFIGFDGNLGVGPVAHHAGVIVIDFDHGRPGVAWFYETMIYSRNAPPHGLNYVASSLADAMYVTEIRRLNGWQLNDYQCVARACFFVGQLLNGLTPTRGQVNDIFQIRNRQAMVPRLNRAF